MNNSNTFTKTAMRVSVITMVINIVLSLLKLLAGIFANSGAMVSDAVHSASDVFSTVIVMVGVYISGREADKGHQYGHERMECVAAVILSVILFATGAGIGINGIKTIISGAEVETPGVLALAAAIVSIVTKELMYRFTIKAANKIRSDALRADAWHHRSDSLSSIGALIGIIGARAGFAILDPIASVVICLFILKAAVDIFRDATDKMVDKACDKETEESMRKVILEQDGVLGITLLRTRMFGAKIYVDAEIEADGSMTLTAAHGIAEQVHEAIETEFPDVKHCMVHVNPVERGFKDR